MLVFSEVVRGAKGQDSMVNSSSSRFLSPQESWALPAMA